MYINCKRGKFLLLYELLNFEPRSSILLTLSRICFWVVLHNQVVEGTDKGRRLFLSNKLLH